MNHTQTNIEGQKITPDIEVRYPPDISRANCRGGTPLIGFVVMFTNILDAHYRYSA